MSAVETLQQANMFTGEWETKRTRNRLEQLSMFSINETFEFGARVRSYLSELPRPTLELVSEDVRTQEDIERDLMREAEALTTSMFTSEALSADESEPDEQNRYKLPDTSQDGETRTKFSAYRALVTLVREQAMTVWVDGAYRQRYYNQLPLTIQAAQGIGLTASEISAAMQIGEFLGSQERQVAEKLNVVYSANRALKSPDGEATEQVSSPASTSQAPLSTTGRLGFSEGLRARLRSKRVLVRTRQSKPTAQKITPVHWMEREYIQKRLPYLAEGIGRLDEDELNSLTDSISETLQQTYWMVMGIILAYGVGLHSEQSA